MPRTFVFSTYGARGDVLPYLAIARELKRRGHRAVLATSSDFRAVIEVAGVEWAFVPPEAPNASQKRAAMNPAHGDEFLLRRLILPALRDSVSALGQVASSADVLVTHITSIAGPIVAAQQEKRGLKWVSAVVAPMTLLSMHDSLALPVAPWAARFPAFNRLLLRLIRRQFGMWLKSVQRLRQELGLPRGENAVWSDAHSPTLALGLFSPDFAPRARDWPASLCITGWCFESHSQPLSAEIEQFLEAGEAPLLFTAASFTENGSQTWMKISMEAARRVGRRALILGVPAEQETTSDRVMARHFAPLEAVLPRCALIAHQGGIGTTALALRAGTPMLICPGAHDQFDTARRAQNLEVARIVTQRNYRGQNLARELDALTQDAALKVRLARWRDELQRHNGVAAASDAIESLL